MAECKRAQDLRLTRIGYVEDLIFTASLNFSSSVMRSWDASFEISTATGQTEVSSGKFSLELYLRHREYNAAIGAALLYLSLLFLRPALGLVVHVPH